VPITPHVLDYASGLAATSNGANLYATAFTGDAISHFEVP